MAIYNRVLSLATACAVFFSCSSQAADKVGISLPTQNDFRQYKDGPELAEALQKAGFETVLYYGGDGDVPIQQEQMRRMVNEDHCKLIIVCPVDDKALSQSLETAEKAGIPVLAYERVVKNSKAVKFLVSFDAAAAGRIQAESIVSALNIGMGSKANVEYFAGAEQDASAMLNFYGMEETLSRYTYSGEISVPSGETAFEKVAIPGWSREEAMKRMDKLINTQGYAPSGKKLDAVWAASDEIADGILESLSKHGYTEQDLPYITGMDGSAKALRSILDGGRQSTVYRDPKLLHQATVDTVKAILGNTTPESNNVYYDEDADLEIPAFYCEPVLVTAANAKAVAGESGFLDQNNEH